MDEPGLHHMPIPGSSGGDVRAKLFQLCPALCNPDGLSPLSFSSQREYWTALSFPSPSVETAPPKAHELRGDPKEEKPGAVTRR